ncbi:MAG: hypothetical protein GY757_05265 [bacterium]|nr:hypothetical protein [bacterium]
MIIIDKIAAVVNDEIITLTDIDKSIQLYPVFRKKEQTEQEFYIGMLQDLINHKAVYLEYKDEIVLREEDYMEYQSAIIKKLGSYDELLHLLSQFDMEWTDLKSFMKEKVFYDKVLQEKFQLKISIGFREIESFYNEHYLPMQKSLQLKPRTLIEMTQLIEEQLRKDRIREKIAGWLEELTSAYTIENKLLGNNQNKE